MGVLGQHEIQDGAAGVIEQRHFVPGDCGLVGDGYAVGGQIAAIVDMVGVGVVHRDADLKFLAHLAGAAGLGVEREYDGRMAGNAVAVGAQGLGILDALFHPVAGGVDIQGFDALPQVYAAVQGVPLAAGAPLLQSALLFQHVLEQVAVQINAMGRVAGVFVALEPVAGQVHNADLPDGVGHYEQIPRGQQRGRGRPQVGPDQPAHFLRRVALDADTVAESIAGRFQGLIDAAAGGVEHPAVVAAAEAAGIGDAVFHFGEPVGAAVADQPRQPVGRAKQH